MNIIYEKNVDKIIFVGDYISDIPKSHEVIKYIKKLQKEYECYIVKGNREQYINNYHNLKYKNWNLDNNNGPMLCCYNELTINDIDFISSLPESLEIRINEKTKIYVSHKLKNIDKNYTFEIYGHTHKPEYVIKDNINYLNPGSVGLGLSDEFCGEFCILEIKEGKINIDFCKFKYDTNELIKCIQNSDLPKTFLRWDKVLLKTIKESKDYSEIYIKEVLKESKKKGLCDDINRIPNSVWEEVKNKVIMDKL